MKAKKLRYITRGLNIGGAEKFILTLSDTLPNEASIQTIVSLTLHNLLQSDLNKTIQLVSLHRKYKLDLQAVWKLRKLIRFKKPEKNYSTMLTQILVPAK